MTVTKRSISRLTVIGPIPEPISLPSLPLPLPQVVEVQPRPSSLSATVAFASHQQADRARIHGTTYNGHRITIFWHKDKVVESREDSQKPGHIKPDT